MSGEDAQPAFHLAGFLAPLEQRAGFAVPVFRGSSSNRLLTQTIGPDGSVEGFLPLARDGRVSPHVDTSLRVTKGAQALWAFVQGDGSLSVAAREELATTIASEMKDGAEPFLRLQIVQFCGLDEELPARWSAAFSFLASTSPRSAAAWRDVVVVPPIVRTAVLQAAMEHGLSVGRDDLSRSVATSVEGGHLSIALDAALYETFAARPASLQALRTRTRPLCDAFGLARGTLVIATPAQQDARKWNDPTLARVIVVGERAASIARHALSRERSTNGSVRRLFRRGDDGSALVGRIEGDQIQPMDPDETLATSSNVHEPVVVLVSLDQAEDAVVPLAREMAGRHREAGLKVIFVVPHLPSPLASVREVGLWLALAEVSDAVWALSDLSPHTRQSLSFGGGRSDAAASGRFEELLTLSKDHRFPLVPRSRSKSTISVLGTAVGGLSSRGLVEHAMMRIASPSIDVSAARLAVVGVGDEPPSSSWIDGILGGSLPRAAKMGVSLPDLVGARRSLVAVVGAKVRPVGPAEFERHCLAQLELAGWSIHSEPEGGAPTALTPELGPWIVRSLVETSAHTPDRYFRDLAERREIRFTDRTIGRRDFLRGVLLESVPANPNRIPVLAKVIRGRWRAALGIARDHRLDVTDLILEAAVTRMAGPDTRGWHDGRPPRLLERPFLRAQFDAVEANFRCETPDGNETVINARIDTGGLLVEWKVLGRTAAPGEGISRSKP